MAEEGRPPVAIRITRPYESEDVFLEHEIDTLTRTSVTLLGAQPRPQGVVLRFEVVLASGHIVLRGEGRVVGFKPNVQHGMGGLTLRFTRLDSRSKALVDKAASLRERRRASVAPGVPPPPSTPQPTSLQIVPAVPSTPELAPESAAASAPVEPPAPADGTAPSHAAARPAVEAPPSRDALLDRLRTRAKALDAADVQRILAQRKRVELA